MKELTIEETKQISAGLLGIVVVVAAGYALGYIGGYVSEKYKQHLAKQKKASGKKA